MSRRVLLYFLDELPEGVDPCGENGEFHTCVLAGPMFRHPVRAEAGTVVERDGFRFADLTWCKFCRIARIRQGGTLKRRG